MSGTNGVGQESSHVEVDTPEGRKPITQVMAIYEMSGDEVRAALIRSIRELVLEARRAREAARKYVARGGTEARP